MPDKMPEQEDLASLYRRAFSEYGASALRSSRAVSDPTSENALAITHSLRVEGDLRARRLAELIEEACRAPHQDSVGDSAIAGGASRPQK